MTAKELYSQLLRLDESVQVEVKRGSQAGKSVLETICAFSNEPGIVEGYILLGVAQDQTTKQYSIEGVAELDELQKNISSQCATMFNIPIRPRMRVIRYDNRIEIKNPGFSLKPLDSFMLPGSELRNPFISSVFHETNLAETKGSGISTIHRLMEEASLEQPTFDSSRDNNTFTTTILLKSIDPETSEVLAKMLTAAVDAKTTSKTTSKTTAKTTAKLATKSTQRVLAEILQKPEITMGELMEKCGLSLYGVRYHLRKLRNQKTIVRIGGTNGGYWKVYNVK